MHDTESVKIVKGKSFNWTDMISFVDTELEKEITCNQIMIRTSMKDMNDSIYNIKLPDMNDITSLDNSNTLMIVLAGIFAVPIIICLCCICCSCCELPSIFPICPCPTRRYAYPVSVADRRRQPVDTLDERRNLYVPSPV